jgi:hypothetical protein
LGAVHTIETVVEQLPGADDLRWRKGNTVDPKTRKETREEARGRFI